MNSQNRDRRIRAQFQFKPSFGAENSFSLEPRLSASVTMISQTYPGSIDYNIGAYANNDDPGASDSVDFGDGTYISNYVSDNGPGSSYEYAAMSGSYSGPTPSSGATTSASSTVTLSTQDTLGTPSTSAESGSSGAMDLILQNGGASLSGHTVVITLTATYSNTLTSGSGQSADASVSASTTFGSFTQIDDTNTNTTDNFSQEIDYSLPDETCQSLYVSWSSNLDSSAPIYGDEGESTQSTSITFTLSVSVT